MELAEIDASVVSVRVVNEAIVAADNKLAR